MDENSSNSSESSQVYLNTERKSLANILSIKYILIGVISLLVINAVILDILFFSSQKQSSVTPLSKQFYESLCSQSCMAEVAQLRLLLSQQQSTNSASPIATAASKVTSSTLSPTATTTPAPSVLTLTPSPTPTSTLREYFIPLGQGNGNDTDWTVIPGIGAKINVTSYGKIEKVYFEATVRVPGSQTVSIRLYNASSQQSIANSELAPSSGIATLLTSPSISLTDTKDENLYQVQLKTQLGSTVYIDQARLRIQSR